MALAASRDSIQNRVSSQDMSSCYNSTHTCPFDVVEVMTNAEHREFKGSKMNVVIIKAHRFTTQVVNVSVANVWLSHGVYCKGLFLVLVLLFIAVCLIVLSFLPPPLEYSLVET